MRHRRHHAGAGRTTTRSPAATASQFENAGAAGTDDYIQKIRNNFGLDCSGVRLPATARTLYTASGKLNYTYGTGSRVSLSLSHQPECRS